MRMTLFADISAALLAIIFFQGLHKRLPLCMVAKGDNGLMKGETPILGLVQVPLIIQ